MSYIVSKERILLIKYMNKIIVNGYKLDEQQMLTILENKKYSLIIAGAGSGKTLTLIGKIKYLIDNNIYKYDEICCISFTNESTNSLKKSILENCGVNVPTYTFHKLALVILKELNVDYNISSDDLLSYIVDEFFYSRCFGNKILQNKVFDLFHFYILKNDKKWNEIVESKELVQLKKTIITFINLMKSNGYDENVFLNYLGNHRYNNFLIIIYAIYIVYEREKLSTNSIDFDDMINLAKECLSNNNNNLAFKFFIIDEFQDTSFLRFNLIRELVKINNAGLCVVGDDYQSIYHFSGCDLEIFLNFKNYYKDAVIYKLENTYRNSLELINTSGKFVMKNPIQIKKNLFSNKRLDKPINVVYFSEIDNVLETILKTVSSDKEILIISRNNFDIKKYTKFLAYEKLENNYIKFEKFKERKIRFMSVHSSKGLESEIVIVLNLSNDIFGFPSKCKDEKILSLVKKKQFFLYEEERRLFYVALTRTKSYVYLLTPKNNPSLFIKEIKRDKNVKIININ